MLSKSQLVDEIKRKERIAKKMRQKAMDGIFTGRYHEMMYLSHCTHQDVPTSSNVIFSRDTSHHTSGWMRNPDYERCWHLSLSHFVDGFNLSNATICDWLTAFYHEDARYTWMESAKSQIGIRKGVVHFRLFCDENWQPILPRGEVYSSEFTELGWKSASQVLEEEGRLIFSTVDPT